MKKHIKYLIILILLIPSFLIAQESNNKVNGIVIDSQTKEPLPFANVLFEESNKGTSTDIDGKFETTFSKIDTEILVSYVGYKSFTFKIDKLSLTDLNIISLTPIDISLQEVTVFSSTNSNSDILEANALSIQSDQIRKIAAAMPDILRSIQSLPGVVVNNEFKADFNVRGGSQHENLVLVNGTQVYEPYHIKEVPNASVGIFNVDLMKKVDLITGGFSARYGDKLSSVLNIDYREGSREEYSGAASLSLAYLDGYIEGPLGKNGSFIFGARKSYMEYVLSMIDYEDVSEMQPAFYDVQGVLAYNLSPKHKLSFEFIHADDDFTYDPKRTYSSKTENEFNEANYFSTLLDLKSQSILSSKALWKNEISYYDQIDRENRLFLRDEKVNHSLFDSLYTERLTYDSLRIKTFEFRSDLDYQFSSNYELRSGISYKSIFYDQDADDKWTYIGRKNNTNPTQYETRIIDGKYGPENPIDIESYKFAAYVENLVSVSNNALLNIGGRIDYFDLNEELTFSPRINFAYTFDNGSVLRAAWGNYNQSPTYEQFKYSESSDTNTQSQKATHYILGYENLFQLSSNNEKYIKLKTEIYYKDYSEIMSASYGVFERLIYSRENDAKGSSYGFDVHAVLNLPGFYSWISYGLLFANEELIDGNVGEYPRYTDQRHTLSFVTNISLGNKWDVSVKANYGSGFPYTPRTAYQNQLTGQWFWEFGKTNSEPLPAYKRVDFRITKTFTYSNFLLTAFIDVSNVFNFKNIQSYEFDEPGLSRPTREEIVLWPILPSFGLRFEF